MNDETPLHRQVNPSWVEKDGTVTSQTFRPTTKDKNKLSVYDGDTISAADAWRHYVNEHESAGVLAVIVSECKALGLQAYSDPGPFPEHAVIDFDQRLTNGQIRKIARKLRDMAQSRGWQYRA